MSTWNDLPALGVGVGFREALSAELFADRSGVDFLEITADHYFGASPEKRAELDLLRRHFPLIPHGLGLSLGSAEGLDAAYLRKLAELVERVEPPWWSEHVAFTRAGGVEIGHLAPLPFTNESLDVLLRNIDRAQRVIRRPLILENITYTVALPGEMRESEFLRRIVERTGCGLLLDVTNLYANARNHGYDAREFLEEIPAEAVVQMHLSGGFWEDGVFIDSHSAAIGEAVWELTETFLSRATVCGVIIERDENIPAFRELRGELQRARELLERGRARGDVEKAAAAVN